MARSLVAGTIVAEGGTDLTAVDVAANTTDGDSFTWTATRRFWVLNGDDASITVAIPTPATVGRSALAVGDSSGTITAGAHKIFGPFGPEYVQADGTVWINYTGTTIVSVTIAVLE